MKAGSGAEAVDAAVSFFSTEPAIVQARATLASVLREHIRSDYAVADLLLTRTDPLSDFATDACVLEREPDPHAERKLQELSFQLFEGKPSQTSMTKARKLSELGVRRNFGLLLSRATVLEWVQNDWSVHEGDTIDDDVFIVPVSLRRVFGATGT